MRDDYKIGSTQTGRRIICVKQRKIEVMPCKDTSGSVMFQERSRVGREFILNTPTPMNTFGTQKHLAIPKSQ